jgi:hypothetical protein
MRLSYVQGILQRKAICLLFVDCPEKTRHRLRHLTSTIWTADASDAAFNDLAGISSALKMFRKSVNSLCPLNS